MSNNLDVLTYKRYPEIKTEPQEVGQVRFLALTDGQTFKYFIEH